MKLSRRSADSDEPSVSLSKDGTDEPVVVTPANFGSSGKGRPTPKRRDVVGQRGPVTAPRNRKEAAARQRELAKEARAASRTPAAKMTQQQRRAAMRAGDPSVLPRRDQGETRKLARNWVDARRMASNYLLILFPLFIVASFASIPGLELAVLVLFVLFILEWFWAGGKIRKLAIERFGSADGSTMSIGFYAGSRAYLPRRWRLPAPQRDLGDEV